MSLSEPDALPDGIKCKVRRVRHACCGMEDGKIYEAVVSGHYASVKLADGSWTTGHYMGYTGNGPFFEIVEE